MARAVLTVHVITSSAPETVSAEETLIPTDGAGFVNDGTTKVLLRNTTAGAVDVTIATPKVFDGNLDLEDRVITVGANAQILVGPFNINLYNQSGDASVYLNVAGADADKIEAFAFR